MKERPILFSAPMVRAILDGRKTQTRRVVKLPPGEWKHDAILQELDIKSRPLGHPAFGFESKEGRFTARPCPYGQIGDRLWVRETFALHPTATENYKPITFYRARVDTILENNRWQPSIFMPRWASRITLEITEVRVERLQEITFEDAKAEGVPKELCNIVTTPHMGYLDTRSGYRALWDSINGKTHPWASNPWVWVVGFKRIEQDARADR